MRKLIKREALEAVMALVEGTGNSLEFVEYEDKIALIDTQLIDPDDAALMTWLREGADNNSIPGALEDCVLGVVECPLERVELLVKLEGGLVQDVYANAPAYYRVADADIEGADPAFEAIANIGGQDVILGGRHYVTEDEKIVETATAAYNGDI